MNEVVINGTSMRTYFKLIRKSLSVGTP